MCLFFNSARPELPIQSNNINSGTVIYKMSRCRMLQFAPVSKITKRDVKILFCQEISCFYIPLLFSNTGDLYDVLLMLPFITNLSCSALKQLKSSSRSQKIPKFSMGELDISCTCKLFCLHLYLCLT